MSVCEKHGGMCVGYGHEPTGEYVYDRRALTDVQRSLAGDIATGMDYGHEDSCAVWWEDDPDGCSCPLLQAVADGLNAARVVEVMKELGFDPTTGRGDRLYRKTFRPHPFADPAEVLTAMATSDALNAVRAWGGFRRMPVAIRDAVNRAWSRAYRAAHPVSEGKRGDR